MQQGREYLHNATERGLSTSRHDLEVDSLLGDDLPFTRVVLTLVLLGKGGSRWHLLVWRSVPDPDYLQRCFGLACARSVSIIPHSANLPASARTRTEIQEMPFEP